MTVSGRGNVTVRRAGTSSVLPPGSVLGLAELREPIRSGEYPPATPSARASRPDPCADAPPPALPELTAAAERRLAAAREHDASGMTQAVLDLETAIHDWAADTDEDQGTEQARAVLRGLITRLGQAADEGVPDSRGRLRPAVEPLLALGDELRRHRRHAAADTITAALHAAGLEIQDSWHATRWAARQARNGA